MPKREIISFSAEETQRLKDALHFMNEDYRLNLTGFLPAKIRNRLASADAKMQAFDASDMTQKCPLNNHEFAVAGWALHYALDRLRECINRNDNPQELLPPSLIDESELTPLIVKVENELHARGIEI